MRLKVLVKGPSGTQYQYILTPREWTTFPFSDGNGKYTVSVYENTTGSKYAKVSTASTYMFSSSIPVSPALGIEPFCPQPASRTTASSRGTSLFRILITQHLPFLSTEAAAETTKLFVRL